VVGGVRISREESVEDYVSMYCRKGAQSVDYKIPI